MTDLHEQDLEQRLRFAKGRIANLEAEISRLQQEADKSKDSERYWEMIAKQAFAQRDEARHWARQYKQRYQYLEEKVSFAFEAFNAAPFHLKDDS